MSTQPDGKMSNLLISLAVLAAIGVAIWAAIDLMDPTGENGAGTGQNFDKELQKLKKFDLALLKWSEKLPAIPTGMELPIALAMFDNGDICVGGDKAIAVLSPDGDTVRRIDADFEPQALAIDGETIFAASRNSVTVLSADGETKTKWAPLGDKAHIVSLAVSDEHLYAADAGNRVIVRYDRKTGERTYKNGLADSGAFMSGFNVPSPHLDVAVDGEGHILTVDPGRLTVQVRDNYGDVLRKFGAEGSRIEDFYGCCNPAAIALLADGSVVTYEKTLQRIKVYSPSGEFREVAAGPNKFSDHPSSSHIVPDIATDRSGRIILLDPIRKTVRVFKRRTPPRPATGAAR